MEKGHCKGNPSLLTTTENKDAQNIRETDSYVYEKGIWGYKFKIMHKFYNIVLNGTGKKGKTIAALNRIFVAIPF